MRRSEARQSNELVVERSCLEARVGVRDNDDESVREVGLMAVSQFDTRVPTRRDASAIR